MTVFLERVLNYRRVQINTTEFIAGIRANLKNNYNIVELVAICDATPGPVARMTKLAILNRELSREQLRELLDDNKRVEVARLEKRLNMLGTMAQISPLLGLLGTVLGFITHLSWQCGRRATGYWPRRWPAVSGRDLVCMALGLAIAIPCYMSPSTISSAARMTWPWISTRFRRRSSTSSPLKCRRPSRFGLAKSRAGPQGGTQGRLTNEQPGQAFGPFTGGWTSPRLSGCCS